MGEGTFFGAMPPAFSFLGDLLFRWVPATFVAATQEQRPAVFGPFSEPVSLFDVPTLLQQSTTLGTYEALVHGWYVFSVITLTASLPFIAVMIYCAIRIMQIRRREALMYRAAQRSVAAEDVSRTQLRWQRILDQAASGTPEGWRLAILEADIMLSELLDLQGYKGETVADKMKQVERANFNTIDMAWEAHKVRNTIAHQGSAHQLSTREVRRVIDLYERVFREFHFIQ